MPGFIRVQSSHPCAGCCPLCLPEAVTAASLFFVSYNNGFLQDLSHHSTPFITPSAPAAAVFPCPPLQLSYSGASSPSVSSSSPLSFSLKSPLVRPSPPPHYSTVFSKTTSDLRSVRSQLCFDLTYRIQRNRSFLPQGQAFNVEFKMYVKYQM